jgi:WD40 repeat protein
MKSYKFTVREAVGSLTVLSPLATLYAISAHTGIVNGLTVTQDGKRLATASDDYKAKIWDISSGAIGDEPILTLDHPGKVFSLAFNKDGSRVVTGVEDGTARIWDATTGKEVLTLRGHVDVVLAVAFNLDGTRVATASADGTAKIWNTSTGKQLFELRGHTNTVTSIAFSPDGMRVATVSRDGMTKLWDSSTGNELLTFEGDGSGLSDVAFSPDGKLLATGGDKGNHIYLLKIDDLIALARIRVTRELTNDECQKYLHLDQSACTPATAAPNTTAIPATDQNRVCQITNTRG